MSNKRPRNSDEEREEMVDEGTESEEEVQPDGSANADEDAPVANPVLDESTLNELDILRSHTNRFQFRAYPIKVHEIFPWYYTDTAKPSQLKVPENYYQRDKSKGWPKDQTGQYLKTVFAGQAGTPFVLNIKRRDARIVDGGHRLNALLEFVKNEVGMQVGSKTIFYDQLPDTDKEHFNDQNLTILEYKDIPLKDEIGVYIKLNSGLQFSIGEKLAAVQSVNEIVKASIALVKKDDAVSVINKMCSILGKEIKGPKHEGRKNELLVVAFCAYNMHSRLAKARTTGTPVGMVTSMQETFVHIICDFNSNESVNVPDALSHDLLRLMQAAVGLFEHVTGDDTPRDAVKRTKSTPFRRMLICMLLAGELKGVVDKDRVKALLESPRSDPGPKRGAKARLYRVLTGNVALDPAAVRLVVDEYRAGAAAAPDAAAFAV